MLTIVYNKIIITKKEVYMWTLTEQQNLEKLKEILEVGDVQEALNFVTGRLEAIYREQEEEALVTRMSKLHEDIKEVNERIRRIEKIENLIKRIDLLVDGRVS
jgi:predicted nuclease with TOPRIM domain